jgi:hypothetical protein
MRRAAWAFFLAAIGLEACDDGASAPETKAVIRSHEGEVRSGQPLVFDGGAIEVAFRPVHRSYEREDRLEVQGVGVPYVKVGDGWLEVAGSLEVASGGRVFRVALGECRYDESFHGDYYTKDLSACAVRVDELAFAAGRAPTTGGTLRFSLDGVRETTRRFPQAEPLAVVRVPGFYIDTTQEGPTPSGGAISIDGGIDVITSFGVKNVDIQTDVRPLTEHVETFELGPQRGTIRFVETGEPRGDCAELCFHDYEVEVALEALPGAPAEAPALVLAYR